MKAVYIKIFAVLTLISSCDSHTNSVDEIPKPGTTERIEYDIKRSQPDLMTLDALIGTWKVILQSENYKKFSDLKEMTNIAVPYKLIVKESNGVIKIRYTDINETEYDVGDSYTLSDKSISFKTIGKDETFIDMKPVLSNIEKYGDYLRGTINFKEGVYVEWFAEKDKSNLLPSTN